MVVLVESRSGDGGCCFCTVGGFGVDFSHPSDDTSAGVASVARKILEHGVTSFCPTLVTSPPSVYHKVLQQHTSS